MQISPSQPSTAENIKENFETGLKLVPVELVSVIPESVWITLTLDQKKEILRQHNLLEKYMTAELPADMQTVQSEIPVSVEPKQEVIVEQEQRIEKNPAFEEALNALKTAQVEEEKRKAEPQPILSEEEIKRIEEEKAQAANTGKYVFFGYQPSQATFADAKKISQESPVSDSKTWAATLISKIFSLFQ